MPKVAKLYNSYKNFDLNSGYFTYGTWFPFEWLRHAWSSGTVLDCCRDSQGFEPYQRHSPCSHAPSCCLLMSTWGNREGGWRWLIMASNHITGVCTICSISLGSKTGSRDTVFAIRGGTDVTSIKAEKAPVASGGCSLRNKIHILEWFLASSTGWLSTYVFGAKNKIGNFESKNLP